MVETLNTSSSQASNSSDSAAQARGAPQAFLETFISNFGARSGSFLGVPSATDHGDSVEEYHALRQGSGLVHCPWYQLVEVTGEDRVRFLNGLITCEIKGLEAGSSAYGFVTSLKGRILADLTVWVFEDRLWLQWPTAVVDEILEHCQKYLIIDRVEFQPLTDRVPFFWIGPDSTTLLDSQGDIPQELGQHAEIELAGGKVQLLKQASPNAPVWILWLESATAEDVVSSLSRAPGAPRLVGAQAYDRWRIEEGIALFGRDFDARHFPQETGAEEAVSYTKGCYLGQEIVARIHYRGGVNRRICGLRLASAAEEGQAVLHEGREAGTVSSRVESSSHGILALSVLHKRAAEVGTQVVLEDGTTAEVVALPFLSGIEQD